MLNMCHYVFVQTHRIYITSEPSEELWTLCDYNVLILSSSWVKKCTILRTDADNVKSLHCPLNFLVNLKWLWKKKTLKKIWKKKKSLHTELKCQEYSCFGWDVSSPRSLRLYIIYEGFLCRDSYNTKTSLETNDSVQPPQLTGEIQKIQWLPGVTYQDSDEVQG